GGRRRTPCGTCRLRGCGRSPGNNPPTWSRRATRDGATTPAGWCSSAPAGSRPSPSAAPCAAPLFIYLRTNRSDLFQIKLRGEAVFAGKRAQLVPGGVFDLDAVLGALLRAQVLDLAGVEYARAAGSRRRRLEIAREVGNLLLELGERPE